MLPGGEIGAADLPEAVRAIPDDTKEVLALADTVELPTLRRARPEDASCQTLAEAATGAEAARIVAALRKNNNNRCRTASELGISRETLYKKLHRYGLFDPVGQSQLPADNTNRGSR